MVAKLDGGCLVSHLREGQARRDGATRTWNHFRGEGVSLRVIDIDGAASLINEFSEEVLYVIDGNGTANGREIESNTGIYLPPQTLLELEGTMTVVSSHAGEGAGAPLSIVSLKDRPMQKTGDRWYRELISQQVTQFVGAIPPGRAPDHHHLYEEVICILDGEGTMWAGASSTPIATGSCIFLPRKQVHCVENRGTGEMRLLGVFYPAGSPAARYS